MNNLQFDYKETVAPYGYYVVMNNCGHKAAEYQHLSFCPVRPENKYQDFGGTCFKHIKPSVIPDYTLQDYLNEYGNEMLDTFVRDTNYKLVPKRMTIAEALAEWNHGAAEWLKTQTISK